MVLQRIGWWYPRGMSKAAPTVAMDAPVGAGTSGNLGWLLAQTSHVLSTEMTLAMADLGLSPRAYCVLSAAAEGPSTQKEIADAVGLDKTTMVVTLDNLEANGLARREASPTDRRARVIAVTRDGEKMIDKGRGIVEALQTEILSVLPAHQRDALMEGLSTLVDERLSAPPACQNAPRRRA